MLRRGRGAGGNLPSYNDGSDSSVTNGYDFIGGGGYGSGFLGASSSPYSGYRTSWSLGRSNSFSTASMGGRERKKGVGGAILSTLRQPMTWATFAAFFFFAVSISYRLEKNAFLQQTNAKTLADVREQIKALSTVRDQNRKELRSLRDSIKILNEKKSETEKSNRELRKDRDDLRVKYESPERRQEEIRRKKREEAWQNQVLLLQQAMKRESKRAATEKFGPSPHHVQFTVNLPDSPTNYYFVIELAPLDIMPHAVHLFLEQVHHGLWNNAWFYINGPHVMQAGPQADDEELEGVDEDQERELALAPFRRLQLETLAFPEYSEDYPHRPWTLGFTGRPGGPDFYINKVDNTLAHGPGGQVHHDLDEFADPCFAKVISGFGTIDRMNRVQTIQEGEFKFFYEDPIHIVRTTLLDRRGENEGQTAKTVTVEPADTKESDAEDTGATENSATEEEEVEEQPAAELSDDPQEAGASEKGETDAESNENAQGQSGNNDPQSADNPKQIWSQQAKTNRGQQGTTKTAQAVKRTVAEARAKERREVHRQAAAANQMVPPMKMLHKPNINHPVEP